MRIEGKLTKWNDDRGFGFITPAQGGPEVFVHISAFPQRGRRPIIGERLIFDISTDNKGKKRATNLCYPFQLASRHVRHAAASTPGFLSYALPIVAISALAFYGYSKYSANSTPEAVVSAPTRVVAAPPTNVVTEPARTQPAVIPPRAKVVAVPTKRVTASPTSVVEAPTILLPAPRTSGVEAPTILLPASSSFRCDGRTRCTQMRSCAEATYFLNHCPGVKMDGDNDGIPCEDQWCNG